MSIYDSLNPPQKEAVFYTEGPLLILAGAGSGKTRVLTHRIAYLIAEKNVSPWNILAITFTNKATEEMRNRVDALVGPGSEAIWVSTFHSCCVRILRRFIDRIGYSTSFAIYDTDDQKSIMKSVFRRLDVKAGPDTYTERGVLSAISAFKNEGMSPEDVREDANGDPSQEMLALFYREYEESLRANNALDFDDLLFKTVELFEQEPEVLEQYQNRFKYILVDEYQDTNNVQFRLVSLLAMRYHNLCVVGDDDQSIYKFRGANIRNILDFESTYPDAKVVRLEENYRSTGNILKCANAVIANNEHRKKKTLWTERGEGNPVHLRSFGTDFQEAEYIIGEIERRHREEGIPYSSFVVLYRTNAQSRLFEEKLNWTNIPYKIIGGINFYSRKEIKDVIAYLKVLTNPVDNLNLIRILGIGTEGFGKGIGKKTVQVLEDYGANHGLSLFESMEQAGDCPKLGAAAKKKAVTFAANMRALMQKMELMNALDALKLVLSDTGYQAMVEADHNEESEARMENVSELLNKAAALAEACEQTGENPSVSLFLEQVSLVSDMETLEETKDYVTLMTLHSAKGLEFPIVFMPGMEQNLFPSYMALRDGEEDIEEERRLCYVGMTRAMDDLTLTSAAVRFINGESRANSVSMFVMEIPREYLDEGGERGLPQRNQTLERVKSSLPMSDAMRQVVSPNPKAAVKVQMGAPSAKTEGGLSYGVGDEVRHIKFGNGVVKEIVDGGRDYEVTVVFDNYGQKKMFAGFAKLVKIG